MITSCSFNGNIRQKQLHVLLMLIVCFFAFFVNNQVVPADLMESRNLATAQEMVREGNYLVPTMNGELRLAKPPLPTWIAAAIEHVAPGNLVVQRYAAGLAATLMVFFLYLFVCYLISDSTLALMSALVLASCYNTIMMGRTATWDIYCHSFMMGAIYFLTMAWREKGKQWGKFILAGIFLGLSFLAKGPVSFYALLLPFIISFLIVYRPKGKEKIAPAFLMIILCLIIAFWWPVYIYLFHQDVLMRVVNKETSSWVDHNVRPWYYYYGFPAEAGAWALFLVFSIVFYFVVKQKPLNQGNKFALIWLALSLLFLSVIPEKKTRYLLPILLPASQLIAYYFRHYLLFGLNRRSILCFRINGLILAVIGAAIPFVLYFLFYAEGKISIGLLILSCLFSWSVCAYLIMALFSRTKGVNLYKLFASVLLLMIFVETVCLVPVGKIFINSSRHSICELRTNNRIKNIPFYYKASDGLRMELVYQSNRIIRPLNIISNKAIPSGSFVFISTEPADSLLRQCHLSYENIGTFDDNWENPNSRRYNKHLITHIVLVNPKS